mmetsp:Transcript_75675/g.190335  ORF Transcript_75675/g.190335 Transcript_75675/m.190335 type:complete len:115 (+) Transcript_75675:83-427(+)
MAALWAMGTPPGAAKLAVRSMNMGKPPEDPSKKQQFPGVSTSFLPHEADQIYTDRLRNEAAANYKNPATKQWFKEHRRKKRDEEKMAKIYRDFREMSRSRSEALLAAGAVASTR